MTGLTNETDTKKRRSARSGHSQRASAKPTAEADKATTKKERGMEQVSDSDRASNRGTNARKVADPRRRRTKQRGKKNSQTRCLREGHSKSAGSPSAPRETPGRGLSLTRRRRIPAQKTGGRGEQEDLEADPRSGEHKGENLEPPKTRSFSEDHPERRR